MTIEEPFHLLVPNKHLLPVAQRSTVPTGHPDRFGSFAKLQLNCVEAGIDTDMSQAWHGNKGTCGDDSCQVVGTWSACGMSRHGHDGFGLSHARYICIYRFIYIYTHIICSQYIHPYCQSHGWSGYGFWSSVRQSCHPPHPVPCRTQEGKSKTHPYIDVPSLKVVLVTLIMRELRSAIRKKKLVSCSSHVDLRSTPSLTIDPSYHFPWSPWSW